ncbi:MAG: MarR family transcriptional regulator [Acidobacteriota bacterium]|nr:MarR family transcriptional regulator [Acidobacteriota bacterium]
MPAAKNRDHIDGIVAKWKRERPDYNLSPVEIIGRMGRIMEFIDRALEAKFQEFGLSRASFDVLATLRREGPPFALSQRALMKSLLRTSGSMSVRIDAMEREELVRRDANSEDRRASIVKLTEKGAKLLERVAPEHLRNERNLLAGLDGQTCKDLAAILRRWLLSLEENGEDQTLSHLGIKVVPPQVALHRRRTAGLPDVPGLLVDSVSAGSLGEEAGLRRGDLIVGVGQENTGSLVALRKALNAPKSKTKAIRVLRGAEPLELSIVQSRNRGYA